MTIHRARRDDPTDFGDKTRPRCPSCDRLYHPDARVPRDPAGRTLVCDDCRAGVIV